MGMGMFKKGLLFIIICILGICLINTALAVNIPQAVLDTADSVYYIEIGTPEPISSGTGFVVKNDQDGTYLLTNYHVVEANLINVSVWVGDQEKTHAEVVKYSEQYDLALLKIISATDSAPFLFSKEAGQGTGVYAIGFPAAADVLSNDTARTGKDATITDGVISNIRTGQLVAYGPEVTILQINADLNAGNSGGPLVDEKGRVVGVNTFGVADSQGIFGSVSTQDVILFMNGTGIALSFKESSIPLFVWTTAAGAVIVLVFLVMILTVRKKRKSTPKSRKGIPLEDFLEQYSEGLNPYSITSLMMPLALSLRDRHQRGELSLKLSSKTILVTEGGCVYNEKTAGDGFVQQRFLSPEQLSNTVAGVRSDIYSFCAIMEYMMPKPAAISGASADAAAWKAIVEKGMAEDPELRHTTMQELIYALSSFNTGIGKDLFSMKPEKKVYPAAVAVSDDNSCTVDSITAGGQDIQQASEMREGITLLGKRQKQPDAGGGVPHGCIAPSWHEGKAAMPRQKPEHRKRRKWAIPVIAAAVIVAVGIYGAVNYLGMRNNIVGQNFIKADKYLNNLFVASALFPDDRAYIDAGLLMENGKYEEAKAAFAALGNLYDSEEMGKEAVYREAARLADTNEYDKAIEQYELLADYKDSGKLKYDAYCRKGYYQISQGQYRSAIKTFRYLKGKQYEGIDEIMLDAYYQSGCALIEGEDYFTAYHYLEKASGYLDADELISGLKELLYLEGQYYYQTEDYSNANIYFSAIKGYLRSDDYLVLCNFANNKRSTFAWLLSEYSWDKIIKLIGFENTADILVSCEEYASRFLSSTWSDGYYYFSIDNADNYRAKYNIPWFDYGDFYTISDGYYQLVDKETNKTKNLFAITVLSEDCISIYAYKNGKTYTLYRQ
jgi:hypothetical protein